MSSDERYAKGLMESFADSKPGSYKHVTYPMAARFDTEAELYEHITGQPANFGKDPHMHTPELIPVKSSNIQAIGHDGTDLFVRFNSGATWRYENVPDTIFHAMKSATSVGSYFAKNVKGKFTGAAVAKERESA